MYISNENPTLVDVYFDDVVMTYTKSNVIQYNEYYPFGLTTANSWTRENTTGNNFLGNGGTELNQTSQLYELDYRNYDPVLGRMNGIDPMATKYASLSPYNFSFNNPVTFNDPSGADPYQRSDDTWWVASRQSLYGSRYTGFSSARELAFQNQAVNISTNPWAWTGMGSGDIYGSEFSQYGVGGGYGSISHQEYVNAVEQAKEQGGQVEFHHGRYWVSVPLVRTFFIETPDDPNYSGYNVTMTWAGREGILVNGGGIRPHYRQTGGSPSISQAGFGDDMLGLWSLASFGRMAYDESRSYGLVRSTKAMYDEYKSIRAFNSAYKVGRQTQLLSNISSNLNALDVIKAGSKRMAFVGLAVGAVDMANKGFTNESMALFAADAVMSYVAFLGPVGAGAAAIYFTGRFVYDLYQASQNGK